MSRAGTGTLWRGLAVSRPLILIVFPRRSNAYLALGNRENRLQLITLYSKSFVYAPSPRLLKLQNLFSEAIALIFFFVRYSLRKWEKNSMAKRIAITENTGEHPLVFSVTSDWQILRIKNCLAGLLALRHFSGSPYRPVIDLAHALKGVLIGHGTYKEHKVNIFFLSRVGRSFPFTDSR